MIEKIVHISDIHIRKVPIRNEEYKQVFNNLLKSLNIKKPDRIVIVGDLVHDYLDLQGEQLILASELLNNLANIAPVRITRGNHDYRRANSKRVDSVKAIVETLNNPNVVYYDKTGFYNDENVTWAVWHHGESKNNPWKTKAGKQIEIDRQTNRRVYIDLFHDPVSGCKSASGFDMNSKSYYKMTEFKGDLSFLGDIHRMQWLDALHTKAYCGSLIAQDFSEGDDQFHGYLLWTLSNMAAVPVPIHNDYSFKSVRITPFTDFDELDYEIDEPTKFMKIRFIWGTLPQTRNAENERKLVEYFKTKYGSNTYSHQNQFIESEKIDVNENITLADITSAKVQQEIFREYLEKIGTDKQLIKDIILLDEEITADIVLDEITNIEWSVVKFGGKNFTSYSELDVDWRDMDGLFQITGINTAGKTTIMKLISYILFGKSLETESRMKYGDTRFINNRNGAEFCSGYLVLEANGEYYGIKKRTDISRSKDGSINGAPTSIGYYLLSNPDEPMDEKTSLETLEEDRKVKTQEKINTIIGSYENFMRIVMTTSDTLNRILSNDMAVFIDSLLYDSGLDIFDKKLEGLKVYQKKTNEKPRITCNIPVTIEQNTILESEIHILQEEVGDYEWTRIPDVQNKITTGRTYVETLTKKLFKIDPEIYTLNVKDCEDVISGHNKKIVELNARKAILMESIDQLKISYDQERLNELTDKKEEHKTNEYNQKLKIKTIEQAIREADHAIEIINGDIFKLKKEGQAFKTAINNLKTSKSCPTCGQMLTKDHQEHIDVQIKANEKEMFDKADQIKTKENIDKKVHQDIILKKNLEIVEINKSIENASLEMEDVLKEIGDLTNDKNDVEKRKELQNELDQIPVRIQNEELKISILQNKIDSHANSLKQIEENHKIEKGITTAKNRIEELVVEEQDYKEDVYVSKTSISQKQARIKANNELIVMFKEQEYRDSVMSLYKKCVHRDGIPKQILVNYIIPKINLTLENILAIAPFKVWLDADDLRPKLAYHNRPSSIIDCICASGKERTFSSIVLKFALNQINVKSKPTMFLLDEVMGKLDLEGSVEEFIEIIQLIKSYMKKTLVIEHSANINPDYLITVQLDSNGISSLNVE